MSSLPGPEILADLFNGEQSFFSIHQIALKFSHLFIFCVCWGQEGVEVIEQPLGVGSLTPVCGFRAPNSGHLSWWRAPLPTAPYFWSQEIYF